MHCFVLAPNGFFLHPQVHNTRKHFYQTNIRLKTLLRILKYIHDPLTKFSFNPLHGF